MIEITLDGKKLKVPKGTTIINAANMDRVSIPHFCYHKKLSIAANCRMCLVEIENFAKLVPACSTIVSEGMKILTYSDKVDHARKSILEFLLKNHPLDCPICDKGGECKLQDISFKYGSSISDFNDKKRVVFHKDFGPLISAEEMSRCIHCTRCIRFGIEIAGIQELGIINRNEHSEVTTFSGKHIESELSGNMIDICPVGALTSKPFRFSARSWELAHRFSISPHDSLGTNLIMHVKSDHIYRVTPYENEDINECWISDRDRFSYEGLNSNDRLKTPIIRNDQNEWEEISWDQAYDFIKINLSKILEKYGPNELGFLATNYSTLEEFILLSQISSALGSNNIDFRLRNRNNSIDSCFNGVPWLGISLPDIEKLDKILIIGSNLRNDIPLLALKFRKAVNNGAKLFIIDSIESDPYINIESRINTQPSNIANVIAEICVIIYKIKNINIPDCFCNVVPSPQAEKIALEINKGARIGVFIGESMLHFPNSSILLSNTHELARLINGHFGFLLSGANTVGGYIAGLISNKGRNADQMIKNPMKSYIILHAEPSYDFDDPFLTIENLSRADLSIAMTPYASEAKKWAKIILPISPFTETSGSFINICGILQSFKAVVKPFEKSRPGWKVLCFLAKILKLPGFEYDNSSEVKDKFLEKINIRSILSNEIVSPLGVNSISNHKLEKITVVPIYRTDAIVRRALSLQKQQKSFEKLFLSANNITFNFLNIKNGDFIKITSKYGFINLEAKEDNKIANNCFRILSGFDNTIILGSQFDDLKLEVL